MPMLDVINLHKTYDGQPLLKGVSFSLAEGETLCLLGSSGSGKSTILRILAGLENAESGDVKWQGRSLSEVPVHQRNFGLMFQDYALFPHLDVFANVAFGLHMHKWRKEEIELRVAEVLKQTNLSGFVRRRVTELSGGEQQRVALARALAPRPGLLMLDEPLGALDRALRESLIEELRGILHRTGIPAIYVTHDQQEAFTIADKILLLHDGQVVQSGSAPEVFGKPANPWVATFLGLGNLLQGTQIKSGVETALGVISFETGLPLGSQVTLLLRPQAEMVVQGETLSGKVTDVVFRGQDFRVELDNGMHFILASAPQIGQSIKLKIVNVETV
ncbi:MAG: ABC transporter ATP-binding protein [Chloroflexota bacterium]